MRDWQRARQVLEGVGSVVNVSEAAAIEVPDRAGGLAHVLEEIERAGINVEYAYAFTFKRGDRAALVLRFEDADQALRVLHSTDVNVLSQVQLHGSAGE